MKPFRSRITPYIDGALRKRLARYAAKSNSTESAVVEAALCQYLDGTRDLTLLLQRLGTIGRAIERMHRDVELYGELYNQYVKVWFCNTPKLPRADLEATKQQAEGRYQALLQLVARAQSGGRRFVDALPTESLDFTLER